MDRVYEEILVKNFFKENIQDRFMYELGSLKKRINALNRLCHNYQDVFVQKYLIQITKPNSDYTEILNQLKSYGAKENCYIISWNKAVMGSIYL